MLKSWTSYQRCWSFSTWSKRWDSSSVSGYSFLYQSSQVKVGGGTENDRERLSRTISTCSPLPLLRLGKNMVSLASESSWKPHFSRTRILQYSLGALVLQAFALHIVSTSLSFFCTLQLQTLFPIGPLRLQSPPGNMRCVIIQMLVLHDRVASHRPTIRPDGSKYYWRDGR